MQQSNHSMPAWLSVVVIGAINVIGVCVIYVAFHDAHKSDVSTSTTYLATPTGGGYITRGTTSETGQGSTQADGASGAGGSSQDNQPTPAGVGSSTNGSTGSTPSSGSNSTGTTSSTPSGSSSLAKGLPCKTQVPPAGVCTAVLSINTQKDGNPYWNPSLLATIKQEIASNSYVRVLGLNPTSLYNSVQVSLNENTWSGNASHCTIGGTTSAQGQSQATTFTLDWNGSKWIVNDAKLN